MKSVSEGVDKLVSKSFESGIRILAAALDAIKIEFLEKAVEKLLLARRIYSYAAGSSGLLASEVEYRFVRFGMNCIAIQDSIQMVVQSSLISSQDVVLAFSQTGRNRRTIEGLARARMAGATTIGVTRRARSPFLLHTDIPLVLEDSNTRTRESIPYPRIPELLLVDALTHCVATARKTPVCSQVDKNVERMLNHSPKTNSSR